jgi:hypothetical protein
MSRPNPDDRPRAREEYAAEAPALDAGALDAVLRATLESAESDERVTSEEVAALRDVARRHGPRPLVLDPIAIDLVQALILVNYGALRRPPEVWQATAAKIATLLFDSPTTRARLENLWARLHEADGPPTADA